MNRTEKKFKILVRLLMVWGAIFAVMLITESRLVARGVLPLISIACIGWMAYYTYVVFTDPTNDVIVKTVDTIVPEKKTEKKPEKKRKNRVSLTVKKQLNT